MNDLKIVTSMGVTFSPLPMPAACHRSKRRHDLRSVTGSVTGLSQIAAGKCDRPVTVGNRQV